MYVDSIIESPLQMVKATLKRKNEIGFQERTN